MSLTLLFAGPRERVGVNLFGELLFASDHPSRDSGHPPVRRGVQIQDGRCDRRLEPITERDVTHSLQHLAYYLVCVTARKCWGWQSLQRQVDVHR